MRRLVLLCLLVGALGVTGCGGGSDDRPDLVGSPESSEPAPTPAQATEGADTGTTTSARSEGSTPLPADERADIRARAADLEAAIGRWDGEVAACVGPAGDADDSDATCTHAAWGRLVFQADVAVYYLLRRMRGMERGPCHAALAPELRAVRGFWQWGAPLDQLWLDERQQPPSRFDLQATVDILRPVPARIRDAVATVCAP